MVPKPAQTKLRATTNQYVTKAPQNNPKGPQNHPKGPKVRKDSYRQHAPYPRARRQPRRVFVFSFFLACRFSPDRSQRCARGTRTAVETDGWDSPTRLACALCPWAWGLCWLSFPAKGPSALAQAKSLDRSYLDPVRVPRGPWRSLNNRTLRGWQGSVRAPWYY